jgi:hypothetical protein
MTDEHRSEVLGALPHRRPHRRSDKRVARPAGAHAEPGTHAETGLRAETATPRKPTAKTRSSAKTATRKAAPARATVAPRPRPQQPRLRQPAQPEGTPPSPPSRRSVPPTGADILGTAVHAAAELAEIGLSAGARALRNTVARLPRP